MNPKIKKLHSLFMDPGISLEERRTVAVKILEALGPNLPEGSSGSSDPERILVEVDGNMLRMNIHDCKRVIEIRERMVKALEDNIRANQKRHDIEIRAMETEFQYKLELHKFGLLILSLSLALILLICFLNSLK